MATITTEIVQASDKGTTAAFSYVYVETAAKLFKKTSIADFQTQVDIVTKAGTQSVTGLKTFTQAIITQVDPADNTKKLVQDISAFTTATTRTWAYPNVSDTYVGVTATQTLTNKTLTSPVINNVVSEIVETVVTTLGAGTWTKPAKLLYLEVILVGGGGGGGGADGDSSGAVSGGGGGGGAYVYKKYAAADLSATENYSVGAGGTGGAGAAGVNDGVSGGATTFKTLSAGGGTGGAGRAAASTNSFGSSIGGVASGGDINIDGGIGSMTRVVSNVLYSTCSGGDSQLGKGGMQISVSAQNGSTAGAGYGGGGGGGVCSSVNSTNYSGGAGANGVLIIREYKSS